MPQGHGRRQQGVSRPRRIDGANARGVAVESYEASGLTAQRRTDRAQMRGLTREDLGISPLGIRQPANCQADRHA